MAPRLSLQDIKQRKLVRWTLAYIAVAFAALQVLDLIGSSFHWPDAIQRVATVVLASGVFMVLIVAWFHGESGAQRVSVLEILLLITVITLAGFSATLVSKPEKVTELSSASAAEPASIAVLPFVNRSNDPQSEYFSDGISEEILRALAQVPNLHVRARTSSFAFKGKNVAVQEIARQLRVAHVLEGSVQRAGNRVRINAVLIDAGTDQSVWSQQFDRDLKDVFALEDDISRGIAKALRLRLGDVGSSTGRTSNTQAHELYLQGRSLLANASDDSVQQSIEFFQRAIEQDPGYAAAHAALGEALMLTGAAVSSGPQMVKAREAARAALKLDGRQAEAHAVMGAISLWYDRDLTTAEREPKQALLLDPSNANAYDYYAWVLLWRGRADEALRTAQEAMRVDPYSPWISYALEFRYMQRREYDRVIKQHRTTVALDPNTFYWDWPVGIAYREKGMYEEAVREYRQLQDRLGGRPLHGLAITYARMGRTADARRELARLLELDARSFVPREQIAVVYANLGDTDHAMQWLEKAYAEHSSWLDWAPRDPSYDPLRSDPRFQSFIRRITPR